MSKPIIALDIDDVLFPFMMELAKHHNKLYGTHLVIDDFTHTTRFTDVWGGTMAEAKAKLRHFHESGDSGNGVPYEETQLALTSLAKEYSLHVITSRQSKYERQTRDWLEKHFSGVFSTVNFANYWEANKPHVSKAQVCLKLGAEVLIDDNPEYVEECIAQGIRGILFGDFPWNHDAKLSEGALRAETWLDVATVLAEWL